jgi:hypothetical protein
VACFLCAMSRISRPTRVLFDDYASRERYHVVERFQRPDRLVESMAVFDLEPRKLSAAEWLQTARARLDPE